MTTKFLVLNVNPGHLSESFVDSFVRLTHAPGYMGKISKASSVNINHARNDVVEKFLETDLRWALLLDSDMVFEPDVVERLSRTSRKAVGGLCKVINRDLPVIGGVNEDVWSDYPDGVVEVTMLSLACLLIHRAVFEDMQTAAKGERYPWFREIVEDDIWVGEDLYFCRRARAAGHQLYVDTTVKIGHQKGPKIHYPD